jgi:hypothetical protein
VDFQGGVSVEELRADELEMPGELRARWLAFSVQSR